MRRKWHRESEGKVEYTAIEGVTITVCPICKHILSSELGMHRLVEIENIHFANNPKCRQEMGAPDTSFKGELSTARAEEGEQAGHECDAATEALDAIAKACGCAHWEYPGQVVRDVESEIEELRKSRAMLEAVEFEAIKFRNAYREWKHGKLPEAELLNRFDVLDAELHRRE